MIRMDETFLQISGRRKNEYSGIRNMIHRTHQCTKPGQAIAVERSILAEYNEKE